MMFIALYCRNVELEGYWDLTKTNTMSQNVTSEKNKSAKKRHP